MAIYQNTIANLGVRLEITHASPDVANNRTTITYKASVYKTGSHNPWNNLSQTPMSLTINGVSQHSVSNGNYDLRGGTTSQLIKTGTVVIPHNADGTKSFTFSWNVNFTSTGYGYGNVTTSDTYVLPNIARASTFTIPSSTITTGSAFTVTIASASTAFTHKVSYIVGNSTVDWTTTATTSYSATVPHALFNSHSSVASVSGVISVTTMNGTTVVGSNQRTVTINLISSAVPSLPSVSQSNSNKYVFTGTSQFIRGMSRLTTTANSAVGSYSSTISSYEFRVLRSNGTTIFGETSKTTNSHQFSAFDFPNSSSETVTPQVRVRDSRGRYSGWVNASAIRVHYYTPPAIGTMTVRRVGSGNTTLQVTRNYSITLLYESGAGSNINTANLRFQHRVKGTTGATDNAGAGSTTTSLPNSNANLTGTFAANTSYEVRAVLSDAVAGQVIGSWISVGTEFVPFDIAPKGVGVGKVHSNGTPDLEVGTGGISSEGLMAVSTHGNTLTLGSVNSSYAHYQTTAPVHYFNKQVRAAGDFFGGTSYNRKLAYDDEINSSIGTTTISSLALMNNMVVPGVYQYSSTELASIGTYGVLIARVVGPAATHNSVNTWIFQSAYATNGHIFERSRINTGAWSGWVRNARVSDIPTIPTIPEAYTPTSGGSDDNRWIRFPSGHTICWGSTTTTGSSVAVTFPKAFSAIPSLTPGGHNATHAPSTTTTAVSASGATFYVVDGRNGGLWGSGVSSGLTATIRYTAVGVS